MIKNIFGVLTLMIIFLPFNKVSAALLDRIDCIESGKCSLNDIVQVGVNATQILLGLSGSVALLFFIYGGVTFLISGGSSEKVSKGKQILINSVIGLLIVFTSFMIIQFTMDTLGFTRDGPWYQSL
ncbi:MAG: hypothetical protein PF572_00895 [Patescibacteria group bacterium]|jgi:hypothetical protein|nr:hypothetical protein [Patescibacteria group bacterium]